MQEYVVGIIVCVEAVLLILKNRPEWQAGRFNGIGGKVNEDETSYAAIVRECKEECALTIEDWFFIGTVSNNIDYLVHYYYATVSSLSTAYSTTDEEIKIFKIKDLDYSMLVPPTDIFLRYCLNPYYKPIFLEAL